MPYFIRKQEDEFCVVEGTKEEPGEVVKCHPTRKEAEAHMRALYANVEDAAMSELMAAEFAEGQPIEILRVGEFMDMRGNQVEVTEEDLDAYVANFEEGAAGVEIPVDREHDHGEAVGWVTRLWREGQRLLATVEWNDLGRSLIGQRIYRYVSATLDLQERLVRAISLTNWPAVKGLAPVELAEGVIGMRKRVGLRNRIATWWQRLTDAAREMQELAESRTVEIGDYLQARLHRAFTNIADDMAAAGVLTVDERIVLSNAIGVALEAFRENVGEAGAKTIEVPVPDYAWFTEVLGGEAIPDAELEAGENPASEEETDMGEERRLTEEQLAELKRQAREEVEAELAEQQRQLAELRKRVREEVETELREKLERRQGYVEFAEQICGDGEAGLSARRDDVVAFLEALPEELVEQAKALLGAKVVDFSERGSARDGENRKALPDEIVAALESGQISVADLSNPILGLGELSEYDLSKWKKEG